MIAFAKILDPLTYSLDNASNIHAQNSGVLKSESVFFLYLVVNRVKGSRLNFDQELSSARTRDVTRANPEVPLLGTKNKSFLLERHRGNSEGPLPSL